MDIGTRVTDVPLVKDKSANEVVIVMKKFVKTVA